MNTKNITVTIVLLLFLFRNKAKAGVSVSADAVSTMSYLGRLDLPRGLRNNNPGNLRISSSPWLGKIDHSINTDGAFEQFDYYVYGVRAMIKLIRDSYINRDGVNTITKVINKYSPSFENNTAVYISQVSSSIGIDRNEILDTSFNTMKSLIKAMAKHENGVDAITETQFSLAWSIV